ncbi:GntR family transcriptional regulator / MocR family aminotransferase [Methylophilus rhizosphaerae]|uniref:GntR family transcriptional regulator / MocR family aminotransferase n=1 Tax=Methylophilus rhizosphaerae TaxID=492660 RepID=A0A1G9DZ51_9PROT|nr:PLP-dependent aminotransferase family protein [Methylophilus rhizosphaerae]SDK69157.1 GntR family transcriptional regulator / MocR family aminotransferase [Methylophilus rhizosphaerae]
MSAKDKALFTLNSASSAPYYRQIYERIRHAITNGTLKPGDRIPSERALTKELGLARGTVKSAYSLLAAEGYTQSLGQGGTVVASNLNIKKSPPGKTNRANKDHPNSFRPDSILPFQMGLPALDAFPRKIWARLTAKCARSMQLSDMAHPSIYGLPALRNEISAYLQVSRGIHCSPSQVFLTTGYRNSVELIAHAFLKPQDQVLIEDPGYPPTKELLNKLGMNVVPVAVDQEGINVEVGISAVPHARAIVVTPGHQSPLGVSLSLARRLNLIDWASRNKTWIIEDDYDSEYRYISRPLPALKNLDHSERVIYSGTFSKVLFPGLRLAYVVIPEPEVENFEKVMQTFAGGCPQLTQEIVAAFMKEGHFARHIQRMRKLYADRRALTIDGLNKSLSEWMSIDSQPGGMHLILRLNHQEPGTELVKLMREKGLFAEALSDWTVDGGQLSTILINFTNIHSQNQAAEYGKTILDLLKLY